MVTAKFSEVLDGYEFHSSGALMEAQAFINLEKGTVHIVSGDLGLSEVAPEDLKTGLYIELPTQAELRLGRSLAIEFAETHMPGDVSAVLDFFNRRGAYSKFKSLVERKGQLQAWFDFEAEAKESRLREWCASRGIELV